MDLVKLLGLDETDSAIPSYVSSVKSAAGSLVASNEELTRQDYLRPPPAVSYRSLKPAGISLQFEQQEGAWRMAAIDLYNAEALNEGSAKSSEWGPFPLLPLHLDVITSAPTGGDKAKAATEPRQVSIAISKETMASDMVKALGEPGRKGGGEATAGGGASGLGPSAWLEWHLEASPGERKGQGTKFNLMIELAGKDARGAGRWEADKAGKAKWGVLTLSVA